MKKGKIVTFVAGLIISGLFLFSACSNILSPSAGASGQGNVKVSLSAGPSGRTLMPSALDFDKYDFTFDNGSFNKTFTVDKASGGDFSFNVPVGSGYSLDVKAYKVTGGADVLAAQGGSTAPFSVGAVTSVSVMLTGNLSGGATGTFSYSITYPAGAGIVKFMLISSEGDIDLLDGAAEAADGAGKTNQVTLAAGWYGLELDLADGTGKVAYDDDIVVIFSDTTTFYGTAGKAVAFTAGDFKAPETPPPSVGARVYDWNGFNVEGQPHYSNPAYATGYAIGTQYDYFSDALMGNWTDVLKVEPPSSGGYGLGTVILTYPVASEGTYKLTMWYWVERGADSNPVSVFWYNTGGANNLPQAYYSDIYAVDNPQYAWRIVAGNDNQVEAYGEWLYMTSTFELTSNEEIGIIARNSENRYGLMDSTLYIRDLKIEKTGGPAMKLNPAKLTLIPGKSLTLHADITGVDWTSDVPGVATVDANGVVTAVAAGTTVIRAASKTDTTQSAEAAVRVISKGNGTKHIALTFDDGPEPEWTPQFIDVLKGLGAHATFMCIGYKVEENPEVVKANYDAGNEIGNHTYWHTMELQHSDVATIKAELDQNQAAILAATGKAPVVFRGPALLYSDGPDDVYAEKQYGENLEEACRQTGLALIDASGHQMGNYDFDPSVSSDAIFDRATGLAKDWGILLMHDGWLANVGNTLEALPRVIEWLYANDYEIMTVSEIAAARGESGLEPGKIYYDFVDMPEHVSDITITPEESTLNGYGDTEQLTAAITGGQQTMYWYSDDEGVATVDNSGNVTAVGPGTTTIRVAAGGMRAFATVTVTMHLDIETMTSWDAFDWPGQDTNDYLASQANARVINDFQPGDGNSYDNVLMFAPPEGGYPYIANPKTGSVGMNFAVPYPGTYSISLDVWIDPANLTDADKESLIFLWHECKDWGEFTENGAELYDKIVNAGEWFHYSGTLDSSINQGTIIGLLTCSPYHDYEGLRDATIYMRNMKLTLDGVDEPIIDINSPAAPVPPPANDIGISFDWANGPVTLSTVISDGDFISQDATGILTIKQGGTVAITPAGGSSWQWTINRAVVCSDETYQFTGAIPGTYKILLKVDGTQEGNTITIVVK